MIRGISLFIAILLLAGNASAFPYMTLIEAGEIDWTPSYQGEPLSTRKFPATATKFDFSWRNRESGIWPTNGNSVLFWAPVDRPSSTTDDFELDTNDCASLGLSPCFDQFLTSLQFGRFTSVLVDEPTHLRGLEVEFNHDIAALDGVATHGTIVFTVNELQTYSLSALYSIPGTDIGAATLGLRFYEARRVHPVDPADYWAQFEWFPLVDIRQTIQGPDNFSDVVLQAPDDTICNGCFEVGTDFEGVLHTGRIYRLDYDIDVYGAEEMVGHRFPEGNISFVVPEPSSDLMAFAGILGVVFLARRRNRAKVS
jgi:hypothetical protein